MRTLWFGTMFVLTGCMSAEQQAVQQQQIAAAGIEQCRAMGARTHNEFFQCRMQQQQADIARSEAYGRQMQAAGAALLASPKPQPTTVPRSVTCRSIPEGIMVRTVCS